MGNDEQIKVGSLLVYQRLPVIVDAGYLCAELFTLWFVLRRGQRGCGHPAGTPCRNVWLEVRNQH